MIWAPSKLDIAKPRHFVQHLAQNLHMGIVVVRQFLLGIVDSCAPSMPNPTSDCQYWPWLQLLDLMWPPVEVQLGHTAALRFMESMMMTKTVESNLRDKKRRFQYKTRSMH